MCVGAIKGKNGNYIWLWAACYGRWDWTQVSWKGRKCFIAFYHWAISPGPIFIKQFYQILNLRSHYHWVLDCHVVWGYHVVWDYHVVWSYHIVWGYTKKWDWILWTCYTLKITLIKKKHKLICSLFSCIHLNVWSVGINCLLCSVCVFVILALPGCLPLEALFGFVSLRQSHVG